MRRVPVEVRLGASAKIGTRPFIALIVLVLVVVVAACDTGYASDNEGPEPFRYNTPWPTDLAGVYTTTFSDASGDQEALPPSMAGPPYSGPVPFPAVDVTQVQLGVEGDFLFMRRLGSGCILPARDSGRRGLVV